MKAVFLFLVVFSVFDLHGQYVKLTDGSVKNGYYLRKYFSAAKNKNVIEFWQTRKDKSPTSIFFKDVDEYAIKRDTVIVLH